MHCATVEYTFFHFRKEQYMTVGRILTFFRWQSKTVTKCEMFYIVCFSELWKNKRKHFKLHMVDTTLEFIVHFIFISFLLFFFFIFNGYYINYRCTSVFHAIYSCRLRLIFVYECMAVYLSADVCGTVVDYTNSYVHGIAHQWTLKGLSLLRHLLCHHHFRTTFAVTVSSSLEIIVST